MKVTLADGWRHPLADNDPNWDMACEAIARATERIPLRDTEEPYEAKLSRLRRVVMQQCQCTLQDILVAASDDEAYLALLARYVPRYDELPQ